MFCDCDCDTEEKCLDEEGSMPEQVILAHSYVPWQFYVKAYSPQEALMRGTLFPELFGVYPIPR